MIKSSRDLEKQNNMKGEYYVIKNRLRPKDVFAELLFYLVTIVLFLTSIATFSLIGIWLADTEITQMYNLALFASIGAGIVSLILFFEIKIFKITEKRIWLQTRFVGIASILLVVPLIICWISITMGIMELPIHFLPEKESYIKMILYVWATDTFSGILYCLVE